MRNLNRSLLRGLSAIAVISVGAMAAAQIIPMPPHTSTFTGSTRGYYFTAPSDFIIIGVRVLRPTGSNNLFQNFAIVRFDGATPPPAFPGTTNAFQQLALGLDLDALTLAPVNVLVNTGDVIGVYGNSAPSVGTTSGTNSYGPPGGFVTTIMGNNVQLLRSGMQFHLGSATSPAGMHDIFAETAGAISRVEFEYTAVPEPATVIVLGIGAMALLLRRRR